MYRNNVTTGLIRTLEAGFPVVRRLVRPEFFASMATVYSHTHPPTSRIMMLYGDNFADFLQDFLPVSHLGYLPDVGRLEHALRQSYHSADSVALPAQHFSSIAHEGFLTSRLRLAPSVCVLRSAWPALSIWRAHQNAVVDAPVMQAEDTLILRPAFDPVAHLLPKGGAAFISAVLAGTPLATAIDAGGDGLILLP